MSEICSDKCDICGRTEIESFKNHLEIQTSEVRKTLEQAQKAYEAVLKNFIVSNITGNDNFEDFYNQASDAVREGYAMDRFVVDEVLILDWMIYDYESFLEENALKHMKH